MSLIGMFFSTCNPCLLVEPSDPVPNLRGNQILDLGCPRNAKGLKSDDHLFLRRMCFGGIPRRKKYRFGSFGSFGSFGWFDTIFWAEWRHQSQHSQLSVSWNQVKRRNWGLPRHRSTESRRGDVEQWTSCSNRSVIIILYLLQKKERSRRQDCPERLGCTLQWLGLGVVQPYDSYDRLF